MGRFSRSFYGLRIAVVVALATAAPAGASSGESGMYGGTSGVSTSGTRTDSGATVSVGAGIRPDSSSGQQVIPTSGKHPHRGGGVPSVRCEFHAINPTTPLGAPGESIGDPQSLGEGLQIWRTCYDGSTGARVSGPALTTTRGAGPGGGGGAGPPVVTRELVEQALANLDIDLPGPRFAPPTYTLPHLDTWFATASPPPQSASATAGGVTVTATATAQSTTYRINPAGARAASSPDDGVVVTCPGPPQPYRADLPDQAQRSTCSHRFRGPTRDLTIDITTSWTLAWTATNGSGADLGTVTRTTTHPYRVQEKHTAIRSS